MRYAILGAVLAVGCASSEPLTCEVGASYICGGWRPTSDEVRAVCSTTVSCGSGGRAICSRDHGLNYDQIDCTNHTLALVPYTP